MPQADIPIRPACGNLADVSIPFPLPEIKRGEEAAGSLRAKSRNRREGGRAPSRPHHVKRQERRFPEFPAQNRVVANARNATNQRYFRYREFGRLGVQPSLSPKLRDSP